MPDTVDLCDRDRGPSEGAGCPDRDGDLTQDRFDRCPAAPGTGATGCPARGDERVVVLTDHRADDFRLGARAPRGARTVRVVWFDGSRVLRAVSRRLR